MNWELLNPTPRRDSIRVAVFDFDGTVSLIREGWSRLMAELGRDQMAAQRLAMPPEPELLTSLEREMLLLSGKPSIYQMERLGELIVAAGGTAPPPPALLDEFLRRLFAMIEDRLTQLRTRPGAEREWVVPGTHELLGHLQQQGVELYLASGTDYRYVLAEAELLQLRPFFGNRIFAPADNTPHFSKRAVFEMILRQHGITGGEVISFGDGYSETVEAKRIGATAIGVASQEAPLGGVHPMKRALLIDLGADAIIPHYQHAVPLLQFMFPTG